MALFIQKEGVFMLRSPNSKELVFEMFKIRGNKVKKFPLRLPTHGDLFPFFSILKLEQ